MIFVIAGVIVLVGLYILYRYFKNRCDEIDSMIEDFEEQYNAWK